MDDFMQNLIFVKEKWLKADSHFSGAPPNEASGAK